MFSEAEIKQPEPAAPGTVKRKTPAFLNEAAPPSKAQRKLEASRMIQEFKKEKAKELEDTAETERLALLPRDANAQTETKTVPTVDTTVKISTLTESKGQQTKKVSGRAIASQTKYTHGVDKATDSQGLLKFKSKGIQHYADDNIETLPDILEDGNDEDKDPTYKPPRTSSDSVRKTEFCQEELILVTKSRLLQLLAICCFCAKPAQVEEQVSNLGPGHEGTFFSAKMVCTNTECLRQWQRQNQECLKKTAST